jgi:hypothetical protein
VTGGQREQHLTALREELARRGVRCELATQGVYPRLRIYCPGEGASAGFDHNVVAAPVAGRWFFFWPWAEPLGSVTRLAEAAARIIADLDLDLDLDLGSGPGDDGPGDGGPGQTVPSLAVQRMLRQARAGIFSPPISGLAARRPRSDLQSAPRPLGEVARVPPWKRRRP